MSSRFNGRALDVYGEPIPGAQVNLTSGTITKNTTTTSDGYWSINVNESIDPPNTSIVISKENYAQIVINNPQLTIDNSSLEFIPADTLPQWVIDKTLKEFYLVRRAKCNSTINEEYIKKVQADLDKTPNSKLVNGRFPNLDFLINLGYAGKTKQEILAEKQKASNDAVLKYCGGVLSYLPAFDPSKGENASTIALTEQTKLEYLNESVRISFNEFMGYDIRENIFSNNLNIIHLINEREYNERYASLSSDNARLRETDAFLRSLQKSNPNFVPYSDIVDNPTPIY
jgi:hypothetical protein